MEYFDAGAIGDLLVNGMVKLNEAQICCILRQVLPGLAYLHSKNNVHRDVKSICLPLFFVFFFFCF